MTWIARARPADAPASGDPAAAAGAARLELVHGGSAVRLLDVHAQRGSRMALEAIDLALPAGRLIALTGPNGAGKTTLLDVIGGRLAPAQGRVELAAALRGRVALLAQRPSLDTSFPVSVLDTVMLGHWSRLGAFGWARRDHVAQADAALERVGLLGLRDRLIGELSAGQLQRLLFARLALQDARLVLLDEPFAAVDAGTIEALLAVLHEWRDAGRTVIVVTHDLAQVRRHFDLAVLLARRVVAFGPPATSLGDDVLAVAGRRAWALS